ncbi:LacI family DNA-binding transcriptional regulator [Mesorhizobium sp.]|uniref:LacI family DNA-binding transcriptional regulator n=1 Tax=Mesorhizobium sp. TaxID=1871066 RepID=UPI000FE99140|nr:LacI family DNA-binding transcriptional regulator [Mesorhizobium sp.]RWD74030.1 MAG: LacI family transcriptional regulator [Mesorhizobium sp.]TIV56533.1 MAG: LacI family transcriptional regulator [Mesorhizobium sp.]
MATIKDVARKAEVSTATVSAVINDSAYVSPELRARVLAAVRDLSYAPSLAARNLKRGRSQLIALVVADLANPFFSRVVWAAEAAVAAWGYSLLIFNSDEKPEVERRILARVRTLSCDGVILVPVGDSTEHLQNDPDGKPIPTVLFGRTVAGDRSDTVTIDNISAGRQATEYLLDLGHTRLGTITGPLHVTTGRGRLDGMLAAMRSRGLTLESRYIRSGEFREDAAYSVARSLLEQPARPTALYVASGLMALGVMRAVADLGLRCPGDISIASTDTIPGIGGLRPRLTRTEHPLVDMTNEAVRLLVDQIRRGGPAEPRNVVFQPSLVVGDSCAPVVAQTVASPPSSAPMTPAP